MNYELIKNIGLGLFLSGTFTLLDGDFELVPVLITLVSTFIMYGAIKLDERTKN